MSTISKEIVEHPKGRLDTFFGMPPDVTIPDILDQTIPQPNGVEIHIEGPKDDLQVTFKSPTGEFSFNEIPPKTRFAVQHSPYSGFQHSLRDGVHVINLPSVRRYSTKETALAILHEKGHAFSYNNLSWLEQITKAKEQLKVQLFSRAIDGYMWVSKDPVIREQNRLSFAILCQEERRASAYALSQVRNLRSKGMDPVPHRKTVREITSHLNEALQTHTHSEFGVSIVRRKESLMERLMDELLRVSPRENNAAVYISKWEDVQRKRLVNYVLKASASMVGFGLGSPIVIGAMASLNVVDLSPGKLILVGAVGMGGGLLYAMSCIEYK